MADWRDDVSGFVDADVVAACVSPGVRELPPVRGVRYFGFVDRAGHLFRAERGAEAQPVHESLPLLNSNRIELLDHPRLTTLRAGAQNGARRSGQHRPAPGGHDDLANAVAGAAALALGHQGIVVTSELLRRVADRRDHNFTVELRLLVGDEVNSGTSTLISNLNVRLELSLSLV